MIKKILFFTCFIALTLCIPSTHALPTPEESLFPATHHAWIPSASKNAIRCTLLVTEQGRIDAHELTAQASWDADIFIIKNDDEKWTASLKKQLPKTDVLLSSPSAWKALPEDLQTLITNRLEEGMGLVLSGYSESPPALPSVEPSPRPTELAPDYSMPDQLVQQSSSGEWQTFQSGQGRVALFDDTAPSIAHELIPIDHLDNINPLYAYDYRIASILRAVQWASQRTASQRIQSIRLIENAKPDPGSVPPQIPPEYLEAMIDAQEKGSTLPFQLTLDRPAAKNYSVYVRLRLPYREKSIAYREKVRWIKGEDTYTLYLPMIKGDLWLDTWILDGEEVVDWHSTSIYNESWPMLRKVEFSKRRVNPTDHLDISFFVRANRYKPAPTYATLRIRDTYNRVISQKQITIPPEGGDIEAKINWNDAITRQLRAEVALSESPNPNVFSGSTFNTSYAFFPLTVKQPQTTQLQWGINGATINEPAIHRANQGLTQTHNIDFLHVPSLAHEGASGLANNLATVAHLQALPPQTPDQNNHLSPCYTSQEFREDQYTRLEQWVFRQSFGTTNIISLSPENHNDTPPNQQLCNSPTCQEFLQQQLKHLYPTIEVLNDTWGTNFPDWKSLRIPDTLKENSPAALNIHAIREELLTQILHKAHTQLRDYQGAPPVGLCLPENAPHAITQDWSRVLPELSWVNTPYDSLLADKVRSYRHPEALISLSITPDQLKQSPQAPWYALFNGFNDLWLNTPINAETNLADLSQEFQTLDQGLTALFDDAKAIPAQIAIYENNTTRLSLNEDERTALANTQRDLTRTVQAAGLNYTFVSFPQLLDTGFTDYSLIILPQVHSLSNEEDFLLNEYAEQGGRLFADTLPGTLNEHGQPAKETRAIHKHLKDSPDSVLGLINELNIPRAHPPIAKSTSAPLRWYHHRYGKIDLYSFLAPQDGKRSTPTLTLPENKWAYDLIAANASKTRYKQTSIRPEINEARAGLIAVLPYRVSRLILEAPTQTPIGQRLYFSTTIKTYDALPGNHLLAVRLLDASGTPIKHYTHTFTYREGQDFATNYIPLAKNEALGHYTLEVRDILTGTITHHPIEIVTTLDDEAAPKKSPKSVFAK